MQNKVIRYIVTYIYSYVLSFILVWVAGVGILFEDTAPLKALFTFAGLFAVVIACIIILCDELDRKNKELIKRIEELENKQ